MKSTNVDPTKDIRAPTCPTCNKQMRLGKSMGGWNWYCPDYAYCGGIIKNAKTDDGRII